MPPFSTASISPDECWAPHATAVTFQEALKNLHGWRLHFYTPVIHRGGQDLKVLACHGGLILVHAPARWSPLFLVFYDSRSVLVVQGSASPLRALDLLRADLRALAGTRERGEPLPGESEMMPLWPSQHNRLPLTVPVERLKKRGVLAAV